MSRLDLDVSEFPLVVARQEGQPDAAQSAAWLASVDALLARKEPYRLLMLADRGASLTVAQRRAGVQHIKKHAAAIALYNVGTAFVSRRRSCAPCTRR